MPTSLQEHGSTVRLGGGRGIVMPASGRKQLANAYASLRVLRRELACRLPVALVYYGDDGMPADLRPLFEVRRARQEPRPHAGTAAVWSPGQECDSGFPITPPRATCTKLDPVATTKQGTQHVMWCKG